MAVERPPRRAAERVWRATYEQLRSQVLAGARPDDVNARRLARFGLAGLASGRPAWRVIATRGAEPRWSGGDPAQAALDDAFAIVMGGAR